MTAGAKKLVEIPRDYLIIMMEAGYVYLATRRLQEAKELFEGMCVLSPKSEIPHIALGNVFVAELNYDAAMKEYRKALKMEPKSALAHAYMGELYLLTEKKEKALEELNKVIAMDSEGKAAQFAQALLDAVKQGIIPPPKFNPEKFLKDFPLPLPSEPKKKN